MTAVTKQLAILLATLVLAGLAGCADVRQDPVSTTVGAPLATAQAQAGTAPPSTSIAF